MYSGKLSLTRAKLASNNRRSIQAIERQSDYGLHYCISLPDSNIPFASKFPVKCSFIPLSKNLRLETVSIFVVEKHNLQVDATAAESALHNVLKITTSGTSVISQSEYNYHHQTVGVSPTEDDTSSGEWNLSLPVQLPESFSLASQSMCTRAIQIAHYLVVKVVLQNTGMHTPVTVCDHLCWNETRVAC